MHGAVIKESDIRKFKIRVVKERGQFAFTREIL